MTDAPMDEKEGPAGSPIIIENKAWEWGLALFLYGAFFAFMLEYHRWRGRNYLESLPSFLFTANKAMGISSVLSISYALVTGPLSRLARLPHGAFRLRRPMGIVGAVGILPHVLVSIFFMGWKFDWSYYAKHWISAALGAVALLSVLGLLVISWPWALRRLGPAGWKACQRMGYALVLVVFLHAVVSTGKLANWPDWAGKIGKPGHPLVPPGSCVTALAVALVLVLGAVDRLAARRRAKR